jgi:hypothetical protein
MREGYTNYPCSCATAGGVAEPKLGASHLLETYGAAARPCYLYGGADSQSGGGLYHLDLDGDGQKFTLGSDAVEKCAHSGVRTGEAEGSGDSDEEITFPSATHHRPSRNPQPR